MSFRLLQSNTLNSQESFKSKDALINSLEELVRIFTKNFTALLFNKLNENYMTTLDQEYQITFNIVKIWKYLCEEHNQEFQEVFFKEIKINYQKIQERKRV